MGIDKTQVAIGIMNYFYKNRNRENGVTISELRRKILYKNLKKNSDNKLNISAVKDILKVYLSIHYINVYEKIMIGEKVSESYRITKKGINVVKEYKNTKYLKEMFGLLLLMEASRPK